MNALAKRDGKVGSLLSPWSNFDSIFGDFGYPFVKRFNSYSPVTEETENEYVCEFDMPGLDKKDIEISIDGGVLTIKGRKEDGNRVRSYSEAIRIGRDIEENDISAEYKSGVLILKIPKLQKDKKAKAKTIVVK